MPFKNICILYKKNGKIIYLSCQQKKDSNHLDLFSSSLFSWHGFLFVSQSYILALPVFPDERGISCGLLFLTALSSQSGILMFSEI